MDKKVSRRVALGTVAVGIGGLAAAPYYISVLKGEDKFGKYNLSMADILLYRTDTWMGKAIRYLDKSEVSHAGLYLGGGIVGEALTKEGLTRQSIEKSSQDCEWVRVFRLKKELANMQQVLDTANMYLNQSNRYAYEQILLLAMVCSIRKLDLTNPLLRRIVYSAINNAAALVRWMQSNGKQPMICSEFVYRSYDEAVPDKEDPYTLEIETPWAATARSRLRGRRRRKQNAPAAANIHPESLLGQLQAEPGGLPAALGPAKVRAAAAPPEVSDQELKALIEIYLAEQTGSPTKATEIRPALPAVTMDDLRDAVAQFAIALHETTAAGTKLGPGAFGKPDTRAAATPSETLQEISADFVTPGDLWRSLSLKDTGLLKT